MPAARQVAMAEETSGRGGSCIAATPKKVSPISSSGVTCSRSSAPTTYLPHGHPALQIHQEASPHARRHST